MGAALIGFPFQLSSSGSVQTFDQDSADYDQMQIGVAALTCQGERELSPGYGIPDPAWSGFVPGSLTNCLKLYGPPVIIESINVYTIDKQTVGVDVSFS